MENQKQFVKAWAKIQLNSCYGFPPKPVIPMKYDKNKSLQITKEGKKNLKLIQNVLSSYGI